MTRRNDGLDLLRATNPIDDDNVPDADSARAAELLAEIKATPRPERPLSRRFGRRPPVRLAIALAALAMVTIAAAWLWTRRVEIPDAISCYESTELDADIAAAPSGGPASAEACETVWQSEILVNPDIAPSGSIPPLTACVAETGALAVFPTDDTTICRTLGLAYPDPGTQSEADGLRQAQSQLIDYFQSEACIPMPEAEAQVRRVLDDAGLTDWLIETQAENPDRPCASHSFDSPNQTIHLVPIPEG